MLAGSSLSPRSDSTLSEKTSKLVAEELSTTGLLTDWEERQHQDKEEATDFDTHSVSSEDSFHSTVESLELEVTDSWLCGSHIHPFLSSLQRSPHALYITALEVVSTGVVKCRTMR